MANPLIAGFGKAAQLALRDHAERSAVCRAIKSQALAAFEPLKPIIIGDPANTLAHVLTVAFPLCKLGGAHAGAEGHYRNFEWLGLYFCQLSAFACA